MMDIDPQDIAIFILYVFAFLHLVYFMIYYGRYSRLNQKLVKLVRMERSKVIEQSRIDLTRNNTNYRIQRMRRICYLPNGIILSSIFFTSENTWRLPISWNHWVLPWPALS